VFDSQQLAAALLKICGPQGSPSDMAAHTLSRGTLPIPSPIVNNQAEAEVWIHGNHAVEAAFQSDNEQAKDLAAVPVQPSLFSEADTQST